MSVSGDPRGRKSQAQAAAIKARAIRSRGLVLPRPEQLPTGVLRQGRYELRFVRSAEDLDRALKLRFRVFNVELGEGLESSWEKERDEDQFDHQCHHLLVTEIGSGKSIGTYRLQTLEMATQGDGFYSAGEFELENLPSQILEQSVEVGRACVHREFRNRQVLFLLWRGLARYLTFNAKRYFFGCCSLTSQDESEGWTLFDQLGQSGHLHHSIRLRARPELACSRGVEGAAPAPVPLPTLFRTYLRYGALVCSEPAIDRDFKTIDYLVLFDELGLDERSHRIFFS